MRREPQAPPSMAGNVFGDTLPLAVRYAEILSSAGVERGLLGPREAERIWDRHLLNCAGVASLVPPESVACDVGSGAGLPGLVVAILRPDVRMILLDPLLRRTRFLEECVSELSLPNVAVQRGRAEELAGQLAVDVVLARAVAPLERLATWTLPLLRPGGQLLAMKGDAARAELAGVESALRKLGADHWELLKLSVRDLGQQTFVVRVSVGVPAGVHRRGSRQPGGG